MRGPEVFVAAALLFGVSGLALAQTPDPAQASPQVVITKFADVPPSTSCAYIDKDGNARFSIAAGTAKPTDIPAGVQHTGCWHSHNTNYPGFELHIIQFEKGAQTPLEYHAVDTVMYIVSGHGCNMVEGMSMESNPGDAVFQDIGAWHQNQALTDDYSQIEIKRPHVVGDSLGLRDRLTYGIDLKKFPRQIGALIRNAERPEMKLCASPGVEDASLVPATDGKNPACVAAKPLSVRPSGVLTELRLNKGAKDIPLRHAGADTVFHVIAGHVQVEVGGQKADLVAGDSVFYASGVAFRVTSLDDTKAIEFQAFPLNAPLVPLR